MNARFTDRVVLVTGAGSGLGRAIALAFAAEGARVVVNDLGVGLDGRPGPDGPAAAVVAEIRAAGGEAVAHGGDIATTEGAASLVATALDTYGRLDTLVSNAGFLRDRMLVNLEEADWDAVMRVHGKGHFLPLRHAGAYWRAEAKAGLRRRLLLLLGRAGHQEHGPDEDDEGEEGHDAHGTGFLRTVAENPRPDLRGWAR
ncbi:SDR family NAD(P)-dependent oxidoreductase, partial [Streptomyces massasporeus]